MDKNILGTLFDFSFAHFITIRVIKVLFLIGILFAALATIAAIGAGFSHSTPVGIVVLLISPIIFLIYVLFARIWCEMIVVVFRIAENTSKIADRS